MSDVEGIASVGVKDLATNLDVYKRQVVRMRKSLLASKLLSRFPTVPRAILSPRFSLRTISSKIPRITTVSYTHLSGLQPDATGFFKNPFAKDDDSNSDDDTNTGIDGSMDDDDN